jgi:hypothetical protein
MRTFAIIVLAGVLAAPAAARAAMPPEIVHATVTGDQSEREREQAERDRDRAREQAERDRERAREQADRDRERARERASEQRRGGIEETDRTTRTFRIGTTGELHLANIAGDIVITRGSGNEAHVEVIKRARGRTSEDAKAALGLVEIDVVERPSRAEIKTRYPHGEEMRRSNRRNTDVSVAFNVTVPAGTRVRATSISGAVSTTDVKGDAVLKSVSGTVRLLRGGGSGSAESISGDVEVAETQLDGALSASSASGSITLTRVRARRLAANSISGSVILDDVECPILEAQSVSGNVRFSGTLSRDSRLELSSHSGNVQVAVGGGSGFEVEATSFSGSVRSDFNLTKGDPEPARGRFSRSLRGAFGDGSAVLELSTFSGNITITKR